MAAIDDQNAAIAQLQSTTDLVLIKIEELKNTPNNDAQIAANTAVIQDVVAKLSNAIA